MHWKVNTTWEASFNFFKQVQSETQECTKSAEPVKVPRSQRQSMQGLSLCVRLPKLARVTKASVMAWTNTTLLLTHSLQHHVLLSKT